MPDVAVAVGAERPPMALTDAGLPFAGSTGPTFPIGQQMIADALEALTDLDPLVVVVGPGWQQGIKPDARPVFIGAINLPRRWWRQEGHRIRCRLNGQHLLDQGQWRLGQWEILRGSTLQPAV